MEITWKDLWAFRKQVALRDELDREIGFVIRSQDIQVKASLKRTLESLSVCQLREVLTGAPVELAELFVNKLPLAEMKTYLKHVLPNDQQRLADAWRHPKQLCAHREGA